MHQEALERGPRRTTCSSTFLLGHVSSATYQRYGGVQVQNLHPMWCLLAVEAVVIDRAILFRVYKKLGGVRIQIDQLVACAGN